MLTYSDLSKRLLEAVPELRIPYEQQLKISSGEDPGPHIVFGDVLAPYLVFLLESGQREDIVRRIFEFLEELAVHPDIHVQEVIAQAVVERLAEDKALLSAARKYIGPRTLQFVQEAGDFWGISDAKDLT